VVVPQAHPPDAKDTMDRLRNRVRARVRKGLKRVTKEVSHFESKGGWRGAVERVRVRSERRARDLVDALNERGFNINFDRILPPTAEEEARLREHYRTLGLPFDANLEEVKAAYRSKMREYHPDRHASDPEREREATEIAQQLSIAYASIERYLRARG